MNRSFFIFLSLFFFECLTQGVLHAEHHYFWNPVPDREMWDMKADHFLMTKSPGLVEAGHFQLELGLATYRHAQDADFSTMSVSVANFELKFGLIDFLETEIAFEPAISASQYDFKRRVSYELGFGGHSGDLTHRLKAKLWASEDRSFAISLMSFIRYPTAALGLGNGAGGGYSIPIFMQLGSGFGLSLMGEQDYTRNLKDSFFHFENTLSALLSYQFIDGPRAYIEYADKRRFEPQSRDSSYLGGGLVVSFTENTQVNVGVRNDLMAVVEDLTLSVGLSIRF